MKWINIYGVGNTLNNFGKVVKIDNNKNVYVFAKVLMISITKMTTY